MMMIGAEMNRNGNRISIGDRTNVGNVLTYHSSLYLLTAIKRSSKNTYIFHHRVRVSTKNTSKLTMKLPWSKGDKKLDLEPTTGNDSTDETAIEKKLGMSSVGT